MYTYEEIREALMEVRKPCAYRMESLEKNIETTLELSGNKNIRIASKSIRSVNVMKI